MAERGQPCLEFAPAIPYTQTSDQPLDLRIQKTLMSELQEARWSVISERGREAASLRYAEAARLMRELQGQKVYGTCVVSDEAAHRLNGSTPAAMDAAP